MTDYTKAEIDGLVERLRYASPIVTDPVTLKPKLRNPDGPEAADLIERRTALQNGPDRCATCGETNAALFCSNGFHAPFSLTTLQTGREQALEEAAKVADDFINPVHGNAGVIIGGLIRALKKDQTS